VASREEADALRFIAQEEPLEKTLAAFPGLSRAVLAKLLGHLADAISPAPSRAAPSPRPAGASTSFLKLYSDGAARGNPGPSGAGAVLLDAEGRVVAELGKFLGHQTNNYAEYMGLIIGLQHARELGARELEVYADSELLIRQLGGRYQVKSPGLKPLYTEAMALLKGFARVKLVHVPRAQNKLADEMSNRAIDERM